MKDILAPVAALALLAGCDPRQGTESMSSIPVAQNPFPQCAECAQYCAVTATTFSPLLEANRKIDLGLATLRIETQEFMTTAESRDTEGVVVAKHRIEYTLTTLRAIQNKGFKRRDGWQVPDGWDMPFDTICTQLIAPDTRETVKITTSHRFEAPCGHMLTVDITHQGIITSFTESKPVMEDRVPTYTSRCVLTSLTITADVQQR